MNLGITNMSIFLVLIPLGVLGYSIYKYYKTKKKLWLVIGIVIILLGIFNPIKFNSITTQAIKTQKGFESKRSDNFVVKESIDQRYHSKDLEKEKATKDFNQRANQ